jgi:hypothetical protein
VARAYLEEGFARGEVVVGVWTGPVAPDVPRTPLPDGVLHQWIVRPNGIVVDPTRWCFEGVAPYVYVGQADHYQEWADPFAPGA